LYPVRFVVLILLSFTSVSFADGPRVKELSVKQGQIVIRGQNLGQQCKQCEIVASFDGMRYSLPVNIWNDQIIRAQALDIGRNLNPTIEVRRKNWRSQSRQIQLQAKSLPASRASSWVQPGDNSELLTFDRFYDLSLGGKGSDEFDVSQPVPACGKRGKVFDSAELFIGKRTRFGEAKITRLPPAGCRVCEIEVRHYWEPTGRLSYQLQVYRRVVDGICQDRIR